MNWRQYFFRARAWLAHHEVVHKSLRAGLLVLVVCATVQVAIFGINIINQRNPILGLRFEGQNVGQLLGNPKQQVASIVQNHENQTLNIQAAGYKGAISLRQLGAQSDVNDVYTKLLRVGREGHALKIFAEQSRAPVGGLNMALVPALDEKLARDYLASIDQQIDIAPINAFFAWDGTRAVIKPDDQGMAIDTERALVELRYAKKRNGSTVKLPTKKISAAVTEAMLSPHLQEVRNISQKPLTIGAAESKVVLTQEQLVGVAVPKVVPDPKDPNKQLVQLSFDEARIKAAVDETLKHAVIAPKPTIVNGKRIVQKGEAGRQAANDHDIADVLAALIQRQTGVAVPEIVEIPMVTVEPPVVQQRQQSMGNVRNRTGTGLVRLTFDDGPGGYTNQILDILGRYNVHATFYVIGQNVPRYAGQMQRTKNEGHKICNHSFSHANLARLSRAGVAQQLGGTQAAVQQTTGVTPDCMRPPYGAHNATVRDVAASLGLSIDMWTVDPRDWARPGSGAIKQRVLNGVGSGSIVLLHVLNQQTVDALPGIIEGIRGMGYTLE